MCIFNAMIVLSSNRQTNKWCRNSVPVPSTMLRNVIRISKLKASDFTSGAEASDDFTRAWCECRTRDDVDSAANTSPPAPYDKVQYLVT